MKKRGFKSRFVYWFDNLMSKGTGMMLVILSIAVFILVAIISALIFAGGWGDDASFSYILWDVLSTTINAWMPASEDGGPQYIFLIAVSALFGVLFTSFLIGIISSAVEDKLTKLRSGNSTVVENNHIVILGFKSGEYTLLEQLILNAGDRKSCFVIADECERETMEELIHDSLDIPKNIRIICRSIDITNPVALKACSPETASTIVVNPISDTKTIKILLAVYTYFTENEFEQPNVITAVNQDEYIIPHSVRVNYGFTMLRTNDAVARIIAHSCTQLGLSEAFSEVFSFEGNELYVEKVNLQNGSLFKDLLYKMDGAVPLGIIRKSETFLNPKRNTPLEEGDEIIVLEESSGCYSMSEENYIDASDDEISLEQAQPHKFERIVIIGSNDKLKTLVNELPEYAYEIVLAGIRHVAEKENMCKKIRSDIRYKLVTEDIMNVDALEEAVKGADRVILLSDYTMSEEESDARNTILLLRLRDIKERLGETYTITAEMRRDDNRNLIKTTDATEFIVSSNMAAMVLAQITANPVLYDAFHELLSNDGNEFVLKEATFLETCVGVERTVAELRRELAHKHCIFVGYIEEVSGKTTTILNPALSKKVTLTADDKLIVIGN